MEYVSFGRTADGREARLWRLSNAHGMTAEVTDYGACLVSLRVPCSTGDFIDVVMGYDGVRGYEVNAPNFGATVGRYANRIGGASFELGGVCYALPANEHGNSLHSGPDFWHHRLWELVLADTSRIELRLQSPDGDQGFPGAVDIHVTYELTANNALVITYAGEPDALTLMNLTNHSYFNLNGHAAGSVLGHALCVAADEITETRDDLVPTGRVLPVANTPFDLRGPRPLADAVNSGDLSIANARGIDHNFCLSEHGARVPVATLVGDKMGLAMDVYTDAPGLQVYTGNYIEGECGKGGAIYHSHDSVCLETQFWPDAPHHECFAQPVFGPGRPYFSRTAYAFRPSAPMVI